ncbi:predicted protein [Nematostella vectensis]|uniref:Uncharacterized protein n=1 Tax=Nematostella vectensis TaxID=45351 RepID=A7T5C2_NEMVE|nr:beta,beta-carotene 15,15'-dioxygenase [Nematostella vectensis]EDO28841.1 predicted protein [Nematostella vectensis]|eukprot:XP_001620941.1 hypothetical protein NEMVEDRAFT_v1g222532 [Nematostella vectensis]
MASSKYTGIVESCIELDRPIQAKVIGQIPPWLNGTLLRNGPGKFEFGDTSYNHWFDGLSLLHRFTIHNGEVEYFNRFLRSKAYVENTKANRITLSEFGTNALPDPCKNIFDRYFSYYFGGDDITDNGLVNVVEIKEKMYAVTETPFLTQIDPQSLDVQGRLDASKDMKDPHPLHSSIAHPHQESDGTFYNFGHTRGRFAKFNIYMVPPKSKENTTEDPFDGAKVLCSIDAKAGETYVHSFGMTENFFILLENPYFMSVPKVLTKNVFGWAFSKCLYWDPKCQTRIHVMCKKTGEEMATFTTDPVFVFHHINAFENKEEIVVDVVGYKDTKLVDDLYLHELKRRLKSEDQNEGRVSLGEFRRYRLPIPNKKIPSTNPEVQHHVPKFEVLYSNLELPQINYERCNGRKYTYVFALTAANSPVMDTLVKINTVTKETKTWGNPGLVASEPVFVPKPDAEDEDEGVVLSAVIDVVNGNTFLLLLDGKTFEELGRAEVSVMMPMNIHGRFVPKS